MTCFFLLTAVTYAHSPRLKNLNTLSSAVELGTEIEAEEVEVIEEAVEVSNVEFQRTWRYLWMRITGPLIWAFMMLGILTRHLPIKGRARLLMRLHRAFGYSAFSIGTIHGILGLFF
jgi:hypothetical protein